MSGPAEYASLTPVSRLFLVRHAPTAANSGKIFQGQQDTPALPVDEAALVVIPPGARAVYTSPLHRARTAAAALFPQDVAIQDERLLERSVGEWEGLHHDEVQARWPGTFLADGSLDPAAEPPGGETLEQFAQRVEEFLVWLEGRHEEDVYLVTHNGWIRVALWLDGRIPRSVLFGDSVSFMTPIELARRSAH